MPCLPLPPFPPKDPISNQCPHCRPHALSEQVSDREVCTRFVHAANVCQLVPCPEPLNGVSGQPTAYARSPLIMGLLDPCLKARAQQGASLGAWTDFDTCQI